MTGSQVNDNITLISYNYIISYESCFLHTRSRVNSAVNNTSIVVINTNNNIRRYHHASTLSLWVFQLNRLRFMLSNTKPPSSAHRHIIRDEDQYVRVIVRDHQLISCLLGLCWRAAHSKPHCYEHYDFNSWSRNIARWYLQVDPQRQLSSVTCWLPKCICW